MGSGYELARQVEFLVSEGHSQDRVWSYTPREVFGWCALIQRRKLGDTADLASAINLGRTLGSGEKSAKEARKTVKKMDEESR